MAKRRKGLGPARERRRERREGAQAEGQPLGPQTLEEARQRLESASRALGEAIDALREAGLSMLDEVSEEGTLRTSEARQAALRAVDDLDERYHAFRDAGRQAIRFAKRTHKEKAT